MKTSEDIENLCKKLKPVLGSNAEKLWYMYLADDDESRKETSADIEIIAEKFLKSGALENKDILLDPPASKDCLGSFFVGEVTYNQKKLHPLYLTKGDFIKQIGIFAITGEGKTNLAYLLALQLLRAKVPFLVIDWKRSWRNLLSLKDEIPELQDVQIFTVGRDIVPFPWNPFRQPPGSDRELWVSAVAEALERSHLSGPGVAYYFNRIYLKLLKNLKNENNGFYPNFYDGLRELESIKAFERELKWKQTAMRIFQSFTLGSASKVFNSRNPIRLENLLEKPIILELDLEMPKILRTFLSEMILRWVHLYRLSQGETEGLRHVLFLEEAHNLFADTGFYHKEANSLENVYREIRAFGQGIVSITQHPSMLPIYLLGNCHTQMYLGLQHEDDTRAARKALFLKQSEEQYLNMLNVGECIVKIKNRIDPCHLKVPLVPIKKGLITDAWLRVNTPGYLPPLSNGNRQPFPPPLPPHKYSVNSREKQNTPSQLLADIFFNPLSNTTERYQRLKLNPKYGNKYKNELISRGYIQPRKIIHNKGRLTLFDVTKKGRMVLRDLGHDFKDFSEGVVHRYWKHTIAEFYGKQGFEVLVEEKINGRPDIIVKNKGKSAAIEIETGKSDAIFNIKRDLEFGFDQVICIVTDEIVEARIRKEVIRNQITTDKLLITSTYSIGVSFPF